MQKTENLKFDYSLKAPNGGGTSEMNLKTGFDKDVNFTNYIISKTDAVNEYFSVYENGLVIWFHETSKEIAIKSNKEFALEDDGNFWLVSE